MNNLYIINNIIEFHPATSTLRDLNNPEHVVILNSPAGRCLLLLIERTGSIVTKPEFFDVVWTTRGMQVSSNTFYQNISILRKGLKKIGLSEELVVTIPRIGLTLSRSVYIRKLTTGQQVEVSDENEFASDENEFVNDEQPPVSEPKPDFPREDVLNVPEADAPASEALTAVASRQAKRYSPPKLITALTSTLVVIAVMVFFFGQAENYYSANYHYFKTIQGCHIFLSQGARSDEYQEKAVTRSQQFADSCRSYPWVYISLLPLLPRTSIIRCDKSMAEPNTCLSDYFFEDK